MGRVTTEVELDSELMALVDKRAEATGRPRDEVIQEALREQFQRRSLTEILADVRHRDELDYEEALELAYQELDEARAERRQKTA